MTDNMNLVFGALADPVRRDIVARLSSGDKSVSELASSYEMSMQAVSKHLNVLEGSGLITRSRIGRVRSCRLNRQALQPSADWLANYTRLQEERFDRLDALLDEMKESDTDE